VETGLVREILSWKPASAGACDLAALMTHLTRKVNEPLSETQVRSALRWLSARGLVRIEGNELRLSEPDKPESQLYESLGRHFVARRFLTSLGIAAGTYVFQDTSRGGRAGHGLLSKPDFTLVAVKTGRFERPLEVTTFEVKNRGGASIASVYEVVAHARASHFPYLACPRSRIESAKIDAIRRESERNGIGLILFDIELDGSGGFTTKNVRVDRMAERGSPDMAEVEKHLEGRLTPENCAKLQELGMGA